jgi:hypothetical protein
MNPIKLLQQELNGKMIAYHGETVFLVQVSRGKSSYKTRYKITGNLAQAVMCFNGINVCYPYNKRLLMPDANKPLLARVVGI